MSYLFDRNFDAETEALTPEAAPAPEPLFTRSDHEQALAEARAAAFEAGYQKGRAEAHHAALEAQMIDFVLSVFEQLAPDVSAALAEGQARREARSAVRMALGAAQLTLYFPPDSLEAATAELEAAAREVGFGGRLSLRPDPTLQAGAVRAAWDQGVMAYSFAEICARILEALGLARQEIEQRLGQKLTGEPS